MIKNSAWGTIPRKVQPMFNIFQQSRLSRSDQSRIEQQYENVELKIQIFKKSKPCIHPIKRYLRSASLFDLCRASSDGW